MPRTGVLAFLLLGAMLGLAASAQAEEPWNQLLGAKLYGPAMRVKPWPDFDRQWQRVLELNHQQPIFLPNGVARLPKPYLQLWNNLMRQIPNMSPLQKFRAISGFVNVQLNGKPDQTSYGLGEYWAAPCEFVKNHGGDCEDFAIAKYFAMRSIGFAAKDLRLLVVEVPSRRSWHALLAARINNQIYIVDNNFRPKDLALPHTQLIGFFIVHFAFNEEDAWFYQNPK